MGWWWGCVWGGALERTTCRMGGDGAAAQAGPTVVFICGWSECPGPRVALVQRGGLSGADGGGAARGTFGGLSGADGGQATRRRFSRNGGWARRGEALGSELAARIRRCSGFHVRERSTWPTCMRLAYCVLASGLQRLQACSGCRGHNQCVC